MCVFFQCFVSTPRPQIDDGKREADAWRQRLVHATTVLINAASVMSPTIRESILGDALARDYGVLPDDQIDELAAYLTHIVTTARHMHDTFHEDAVRYSVLSESRVEEIRQASLPSTSWQKCKSHLLTHQEITETNNRMKFWTVESWFLSFSLRVSACLMKRLP